jgi:hypothetical protein
MDKMNDLVIEFCKSSPQNVPIVLLTSGYVTNINEELLRVRSGIKSARTAEEFLRYGFNVVFLKSCGYLCPYSTYIPSSPNDLIDCIQNEDDSNGNGKKLVINLPDVGNQNKLVNDICTYESESTKNSLLVLEFENAKDYENKLECITKTMESLLSIRSRLLLYLTAIFNENPIANDDVNAYTSSNNNDDANDDSIDDEAVVMTSIEMQWHLENQVQKWAPSAFQCMDENSDGNCTRSVDDVVQAYLQWIITKQQFHIHGTMNQYRNQAIAYIDIDKTYRGKAAQIATNDDGSDSDGDVATTFVQDNENNFDICASTEGNYEKIYLAAFIGITVGFGIAKLLERFKN